MLNESAVMILKLVRRKWFDMFTYSHVKKLPAIARTNLGLRRIMVKCICRHFLAVHVGLQ